MPALDRGHRARQWLALASPCFPLPAWSRAPPRTRGRGINHLVALGVGRIGDGCRSARGGVGAARLADAGAGPGSSGSPMAGIGFALLPPPSLVPRAPAHTRPRNQPSSGARRRADRRRLPLRPRRGGGGAARGCRRWTGVIGLANGWHWLRPASPSQLGPARPRAHAAEESTI